MNKIIRKLSEVEHILTRPNMYIGAVDLTTSNEYLFEDGKIQYKEVKYVPGLIKIINEVIDNAVDVAVKTDFKHSNIISVKITEDSIEVQDNGTGIPVEQVAWNTIQFADGRNIGVNNKWIGGIGTQYSEKDGCIHAHTPNTTNPNGNLGKGKFEVETHWMPELAWGHARAGSNFDDDENRTQIGMNGVGAFATNCFSNKFVGCTDDGINRYTITFKENAENFTDKQEKTKGKSGVNVKFWPDLERFGVAVIDDIHMNMIKQRLINLNMTYPEITFKFNGKKIGVNSFKKYVALFNEVFEIYETEDYKFAILPNAEDDFRQFSYVNGLKIPDGGTHIDIISWAIMSRVRDKLIKKFKTIKPADVKNKLMIVAFLKNVKNTKFNSQTKEKITNGVSEINEYFGDIPWDDFAKKILRNKEIIDPITEIYRIKEEFKRRQELKGLNKNTKRIKSEKYLPSIGEKKYLILVEGESARAGLEPVLGRKQCGYYELKGKPLNAYSADQVKFTQNKELTELYKIIQNEGYEYIVYGTDQDLDGFHIRGLLTGFVVRYLPELKGKIGMLQTPVIAVKKNKKITRWFYSLNDDIILKPGETSKYYKGLGTWKTPDLKEIVAQDGMSKMIQMIDFNDDKIIEDWLGNDSEPRKKYLLANDFSIAKA